MHAMQQALSENERFKALDKKTSDVILYCSKLKIDFDAKEEEEFDMCKAFEDYKNQKFYDIKNITPEVFITQLRELYSF